MSALTVVGVVCYGGAIVGGLALFAAPFTRSSRTSPHWVRVALWICGPAAAAWGALGLTLIFTWELLPRNIYGLAVHYKTLLAGIVFGILVLLFVSGEFVPAFFRKRAESR